MKIVHNYVFSLGFLLSTLALWRFMENRICNMIIVTSTRKRIHIANWGNHIDTRLHLLHQFEVIFKKDFQNWHENINYPIMGEFMGLGDYAGSILHVSHGPLIWNRFQNWSAPCFWKTILKRRSYLKIILHSISRVRCDELYSCEKPCIYIYIIYQMYFRMFSANVGCV